MFQIRRCATNFWGCWLFARVFVLEAAWFLRAPAARDGRMFHVEDFLSLGGKGEQDGINELVSHPIGTIFKRWYPLFTKCCVEG